MTETMTLKDGRTLAFDSYGDPDGTPVIFSHGFSDSHVIRNPDDALTASLGARWIAADQPGVGGSSPKKGRKMVDWGSDMEELADYLGLQRFNAADHTHSRLLSICQIASTRSRWHLRWLPSMNPASPGCS